MGFLGGSVVKNVPANAGDAGDTGLMPELERSPEEGNGNPLQYSCWENPMERGAWRSTIHGVTKSQTLLSVQACARTHTQHTSLYTSTHTLSNKKKILSFAT